MTKSKKDIHETAIISTKAKIGAGTVIGPYCIIGDNVQLGKNIKLHSHVVVEGHTKIGDGTEIFPFASIGHIPQDLKYKGEKSTLTIGKNNIIREYVTINPGTEGGAMTTKIGDNCLLMVGVHIAHDCMVGNNVIMANNATLAGHVEVGDNAVIGGLSAIHQFVRVGNNAMIGGMSGIENDIIPYGQATGERANLNGLNLVGLKRGNFSKEEINELRSAFKEIFSGEGTLLERIEHVSKNYRKNKCVTDIVKFITNNSSRAICQPKSR